MQQDRFNGKPALDKIQLAFIRTDGGTQARVKLDQDAIQDYADAYRQGCPLPPIVVFFDGTYVWLADGFHRVQGGKLAELVEIDAEVRQGTQQDAIFYACGANLAHGVRRTNADKRQAVEKAIAVKSTMSDRAIAEHCGVGNQMVGDVRRRLCDSHSQTATRTGRDGRTIDTSNIGRQACSEKQGTQ